MLEDNVRLGSEAKDLARHPAHPASRGFAFARTTISDANADRKELLLVNRTARLVPAGRISRRPHERKGPKPTRKIHSPAEAERKSTAELGSGAIIGHDFKAKTSMAFFSLRS